MVVIKFSSSHALMVLLWVLLSYPRVADPSLSAAPPFCAVSRASTVVRVSGVSVACADLHHRCLYRALQVVHSPGFPAQTGFIKYWEN